MGPFLAEVHDFVVAKLLPKILYLPLGGLVKLLDSLKLFECVLLHLPLGLICMSWNLCAYAVLD